MNDENNWADLKKICAFYLHTFLSVVEVDVDVVGYL